MEEIIKNFFQTEEGVWILELCDSFGCGDSSYVVVAVLFKGKKNVLEVYDLKCELEKLLNKPVELVDIKTISKSFQYQIITFGKKIKTSPEAERFEKEVLQQCKVS